MEQDALQGLVLNLTLNLTLTLTLTQGLITIMQSDDHTLLGRTKACAALAPLLYTQETAEAFASRDGVPSTVTFWRNCCAAVEAADEFTAITAREQNVAGKQAFVSCDACVKFGTRSLLSPPRAANSRCV